MYNRDFRVITVPGGEAEPDYKIIPPAEPEPPVKLDHKLKASRVALGTCWGPALSGPLTWLRGGGGGRTENAKSEGIGPSEFGFRRTVGAGSVPDRELRLQRTRQRRMHN